MNSSLRRQTSRDARDKAGFTLMEVLVALIIFAIGVLALALCVPAATKRVTASGKQTLASTLAAQAAEELLTVPYGDGTLTPGTHDDPANPHEGVYFVRWVVEDNQPIASCKRIRVSVARGAAGNPPEARVVIVSPRSGG